MEIILPASFLWKHLTWIFLKKQAKKYGFNENEYLEAVKKVPVWTKQQLNNYLFFIKGLIEVISNIGLKNLKEIEIGKQLQESEEKFHAVMDQSLDGILIADEEGILIDWNRKNGRYYRL